MSVPDPACNGSGSGYVPGAGIARSYGSFTFSFLRKLYIAFHHDRTRYNPAKFPMSLHSQQHTSFSVHFYCSRVKGGLSLRL